MNYAKKSEQYLAYVSSWVVEVEHYFYSSLILLGLYCDMNLQEQKEYLEFMNNYQKKIKKCGEGDFSNQLMS